MYKIIIIYIIIFIKTFEYKYLIKSDATFSLHLHLHRLYHTPEVKAFILPKQEGKNLAFILAE